jgi:hypothetical protein
MTIPLASWASRRSRASMQRGVAAIAMAVLTVGVAGVALGGFLVKRSQDAQSDAHAQREMLQWADRAVRGFLSIHGRLPCPASQPRGPENCGFGPKGWLPVETLMDLDGNTAPSAEATMATRYVANKGLGGGPAARDMTLNEAFFRPSLVSGAPDPTYPTNIVSSLDLCAKLLGLGGLALGEKVTYENAEESTEIGPIRWRIGGSGQLPESGLVSASAMLFGVAVSAPRAPDTNSGVNANFGDPQLESPARRKDAGYTDMVSVTTPKAYFEASGCPTAMASMDVMHMANAWVGDAQGYQAGNIVAGNAFGEIVQLGALADGFFLIGQVADMANGGFNFGDNTEKMAAAIAAFQFYQVPTYLAGIASANAGMLLSAVDLVRTGLCLAIDARLSAEYFELAEKAAAITVWNGGQQILKNAHESGIAPVMPALTPLALPAPVPGT